MTDPSIRPPVRTFDRPFIHSPVRPFVRAPVPPPVHSSVHPSIRFSLKLEIPSVLLLHAVRRSIFRLCKFHFREKKIRIGKKNLIAWNKFGFRDDATRWLGLLGALDDAVG